MPTGIPNPDSSPLAVLLSAQGAVLPLGQRQAMLRALRANPETNANLDSALLERIRALTETISLAREERKTLLAKVEQLTKLPWYPAVVARLIGRNGDLRVMVRQGSSQRIVNVSPDIQATGLSPGDEVYLNQELSLIVARADPNQAKPGGATCVFERKMPDGRLAVKCRDEVVLVHAVPRLQEAQLRPGDLLRWDPVAFIACEPVERSQDSALLIEEAPKVSFDEIGGLEVQIEEIRETFELHLNHSELAARFHLRRKGSLLLVGPGGNGKTMIGKALAHWIGERSPAGRARFMNIKPGALHSKWYSESEAQYREVFRVARELGEQEPSLPVVLFFDEVDAIGAVRGRSHLQIHDSVLNSFIAELDGFTDRGNVLVVAATNRRDALDPALLRPGRLGDLVIEVPRPGAKAARDIFAKHLPSDLPYAPCGPVRDQAALRAELIETAISRIYAPNRSGQDLALLTFRDNKRRAIGPRDLVSGALIANICVVARERACRRSYQSGRTGLEIEDLLEAIDREFHTAAAALTPANCRHHLSDLPYDVDVVNVERPKKRPVPAHRIINLE